MAIDGGMTTAIAPDEAIRLTVKRSLAAAAERRKDEAADGRDGADRGVGHGAKELGGGDRGDRQRAACAAGERRHPDDDAPRDAALAHDLAGEYEERDRQQRKAVEAAEHVGLDGGERNVDDEQDGGERGNQENEIDRQADAQQDHRQDEEDEIG